MEEKRPKVGTGVLIFKDGKVLLGKRKGKNGPGMWCPPGGHLEFDEEIEDCVRRETLEEAGIEITNVKLGPYTNDNKRPDGHHYITLFCTADYKSGEVQVMEPDKCEEWQWFEWGKFPEPLFYPMQNLLKLKYEPDNL